MRLYALIFLFFLWGSADVQATVACPDLVRDKISFMFVATGKARAVIEPVRLAECPVRAGYNQCIGPIRAKDMPLQRMIFDAEEIHYIHPAFMPLPLQQSYRAGTYANDIEIAPRSVIIVGTPDILKKRGLLRAQETYGMPGVVDVGDLNAASGCTPFIPESAANFAAEVQKAKTLRE